jgi:hypothetical protein
MGNPTTSRRVSDDDLLPNENVNKDADEIYADTGMRPHRSR